MSNMKGSNSSDLYGCGSGWYETGITPGILRLMQDWYLAWFIPSQLALFPTLFLHCSLWTLNPASKSLALPSSPPGNSVPAPQICLQSYHFCYFLGKKKEWPGKEDQLRFLAAWKCLASKDKTPGGCGKPSLISHASASQCWKMKWNGDRTSACCSTACPMSAIFPIYTL